MQHDQLTLLRKLQDYDLDIQAIEARTARLREALDELSQMHESLNEALEGQKTQLDQTRALLRDKQIELEANDERYKSSKAKLNNVSNTREYNALEKELDTLKKMRAQFEEEYEQHREAVEGYEADVAEKSTRIGELETEIQAQQDAIARETAAADRGIEDLVRERDRLKAALPKPVVRRYEFIASRRPGRAIVPARDGVCTGCNMLLPPQLYNELQMQNRMHQCPSCQRVLYWETEQERAAATAEAP